MLRALTVVLVALAAAACGQRPLPQFELSGATMGTTFSVTIVAPGAGLDLERLSADIDATLAALEQDMSTYIADSGLSLFNASRDTGWQAVSAELCAVVEASLDLSRRSDGAFDVTVGPLVNLWGFGPDGQVDVPPGAESVASVRQRVGYTRLHADCSRPALRKSAGDLYVDLSAIAKGHAVDRVATLLANAGLADYLVEIGGELRGQGRNARREKWAIGIEMPGAGVQAVLSVVRLSDFAMATSGDYRNYFEHEGNAYSHTIDPRTGYPVRHAAASVTVIAESAGFADGMATTLLVLGPEAGMELAERERVAALFLLRGKDGFEERMSTVFAHRVSGG